MLNLDLEFDRQVETLLTYHYPQSANLSAPEFLTHITPLKSKLANLQLPDIDLEHGILPFVIVISSHLINTETLMALTQLNSKAGITKLYPREPQDFQPIPSVQVPDTSAYLLLDIDRGRDFLNVTPQAAVGSIIQNHRSPLTISEGIALITHFPEFLRKNNCFSLAASRFPADKRVPAIWINGSGHPNLGWCWDGNPHTWLGTASCSSRMS